MKQRFLFTGAPLLVACVLFVTFEVHPVATTPSQGKASDLPVRLRSQYRDQSEISNKTLERHARGETHIRSSRQLSSTYTDSVYSMLSFVQNFTRSICTSSLKTAVVNDPGGPTFYSTRTFQVAFYKIGASGSPRNVSFTFPSTDRCGAIGVTMKGWSSQVDLDMCCVVFFYNPVNVTLARTSDNIMNGSAQEEYGLPYPIDSSVCPLWIDHYEASTNRNYIPYVELKLDFHVPWSSAMKSFPVGAGLGPFSYQHVYFQATCQQWFWFESREQGSWYKLHYKRSLSHQNVSDFCEILDGVVLPPPETMVSCTFDNEASPPKALSSNIFAIVMEPTDCAGVVDVPTVASAPFANIGQFASLYGVPTVRSVCDKCNKCGGFDRCQLGCDGVFSSGMILDSCGVCGGVCFLPMCTAAQCSGFYVRYLGDEYSKKHIVSASGLTVGVLFSDGPCIGSSPALSAGGVCETLGEHRLERYPFNSVEMSCWENSPLLDNSKTNESCTFTNGSLLVEGPLGTTSVIISVKVAGSENVTAGEILILAGRSYTATAQSAATINLQGTARELTTEINTLKYLPVPHWNSKFPPQYQKYLQFKFPGNAMLTGVRIAVLPVNDPPVILFPAPAYVIQEDKASRLNNPAISISDDANDVSGSKIILEIQTNNTGSGVRVSSLEPFVHYLRIHDGLDACNAFLKNLEYLSATNSNYEYGSQDFLTVTVNDTGSGGVSPYDTPFVATRYINVTVVPQNDPPFAMMPSAATLFQFGQTSIVGAHIVDVDAYQYRSPEPLYQSMLASDVAKLTLPLLKYNCTLLYNMPFIYWNATLVKYVDEAIPDADPVLNQSSFLKLNSMQGKRKVIYLGYNISNSIHVLQSYLSAQISLSLYKYDCKDEQFSTSKGACTVEGNFSVNLVSCSILASTKTFTWSTHLQIHVIAELGVTSYNTDSATWVTSSIDVPTLLANVNALNQGVVCLQLNPIAVVETLRFFAPYFNIDANHEYLNPTLQVYSGANMNLTFRGNQSYSSCGIQLRQGQGYLDSVVQIEASLTVTNLVLGDFSVQSFTNFSNILNEEKGNVSLQVLDISAISSCLQQQLLFGPQDCYVPNMAYTNLRVIPMKERRTNLYMQPWYADSWLRELSVKGDLPAYVALEDCGNRGWYETCPYLIQILPEPIPGESRTSRFTVEVSSRLGTITIPDSIRPHLTFTKGDGFRNQVVRFSGYASDVRQALMNAVYQTNIDENLQYANAFSAETNPDYVDCPRECFLNNVAEPVFLGVQSSSGCSLECAKRIYERTNSPSHSFSTAAEMGTFLDDLVITFDDDGASGIGMTKYKTVLLYNIYSMAVNDKPCVIFQGKLSSGCRQKCANTNLPYTCHQPNTGGLPFDLNSSVNIAVFERSTIPIPLGSLMTKIVDEFEDAPLDCKPNISKALVEGESLSYSLSSLCPQLTFDLSAKHGSLSLSKFDNLRFFKSPQSQFMPEMSFLASIADANAATHLLRYQLSARDPYFNSNVGTETISIVVSDQGFSGSDQTGQYDFSSAASTLQVPVNVIPVNNPPTITTPRTTDPIAILENTRVQLSQAALSPGLGIADVDSDECIHLGKGYGQLTLRVEVVYGRIFIPTASEAAIEALNALSASSLTFFLQADCKNEECSMHATAGDCATSYECVWDPTSSAEVGAPGSCICKTVPPGLLCSSLAMRGFQGDIQNALQSIVYVPRENSNYLSLPTGEALSIMVSDKLHPNDPLNLNFSCGLTSSKHLNWIEGKANIKIVPQSQPCHVSLDGLVENSGFEHPSLCQGVRDCSIAFLQPNGSTPCVGVLSSPAQREGSWAMSPLAGISFDGWDGDFASPEGLQHLYMLPSPAVDVNQTVDGLTLGASFQISMQVGVSSNGNEAFSFEAFLNHSDMNAWEVSPPTINASRLEFNPANPFKLFYSASFTSYRNSYPLVLRASSHSRGNPNGQMVLVDDVQVKFLGFNLLEGGSLRFNKLKVIDPDYSLATEQLMKKSGIEFSVSVALSVEHGIFSLLLGRCEVKPPGSKISEEQLYEWGAQCAAYLNNSQLSLWANQTLNRPTCPPGWYGSDTEMEPCVNLPVTSISVTWNVPYLSSLFPAGQKMIPTNQISLSGNITNVQKVINDRLIYYAEKSFNTNNLGKEFLHVSCDDQGNFGVKISNSSNQTYPINIINVNDPPNVTFISSTLSSLENQTIRLSNFILSDPDINEKPCAAAPCAKAQGRLALKIDGLTGTMNVTSSSVVDLRSLLAKYFGFVTRESYLQLCIMKISCNPSNQFLSLNGISLADVCQSQTSECERVKLYCSVASMALGALSEAQCLQTFVDSSLYQQLSSNALKQAEIAVQDTILQLTAGNYVLGFANASSLVLLGVMRNVQSLIDSNAIYYHPPQYDNGEKVISFQVNDLGNVGIGYPCNAPADVPADVMFAYCSTNLPFKEQIVTRWLTLQIQAVNNPPVLFTFNTQGTVRYSNPFPLMQAVQNETTSLNKVEVEDVDIADTPGCMMNVSIQTSSGGNLFLNASLAPAVKFVSNVSGPSVSFYGLVPGINAMLARLQYQSDPQFTGIEAIRFKLNDNGCTGINLNGRNETAVTYTLNIVVTRSQPCVASTCAACIQQRVQKCGWCPSACGGKGKCLEAASIGGPPRYGTCSTYCDDTGCYSWNMCTPRQVNTWQTTSTGAPLLFVLIVFLYLFFMWARRNHGTFPIYLVKLSENFLRSTQHISFSPQENAHMGKIFYLVIVIVLACLIPGLISSLNNTNEVVQTLERATSISIQTDGCKVNFVKVPSIGLYDPTSLSFRVSPQGGGSAVSVLTDFCSADQYVRIHNTRAELTRYVGYDCEIQIHISPDPNHIIPITSISNVGSKPSVIQMLNTDDTLNFGPNSLSLAGTFMQVELYNIRARMIMIPGLNDGFVILENCTFQSITAMTANADIEVTVSDDASMLLPYSLQYEQRVNDVCFMSKQDPAFQLDNFCQESLRNVSVTRNVSRIVDGQLVTAVITTTQLEREWTCQQNSYATLIPYELKNDLSTSRVQVNLMSTGGQIFFSSIPTSRLPPMSGNQALDKLYVYDGIYGSRTLAFQNTSASFLHLDFHPGESNRPQVEWYEIKLHGPGSPTGSFVWTSSFRYLVLPRFLLYLVSFGLLDPKDKTVNVDVKPSLCPTVDLGPNAAQGYTMPNQTIEFPAKRRSSVGNVDYLIQYYQLIFSTIDGENMASNSILVYRLDANSYISFQHDPFSGQITATSIQRSNSSFVIIILLLGLGLPLVLAIGLMVYLGFKIRVGVDQLRERAIEDELSVRQLFEGSKMNPNNEQYQKVVDSLYDQFYAKTNLFYVIDTLITEADHAQSLYEQLSIFLTHMILIAISSVPSILFAINLSDATHRYVCPEVTDKLTCQASLPAGSWAIIGVCVVYFALSFFELYAFYGNLRWSPWRKYLRRAWYTGLTLIFTASAYYFFIVLTWIIFGLFFSAAFFLPYVVAVFGIVFVIGRYSLTRKKLYGRIRVSVGEQSKMLFKRKTPQIPKESLDTLIKKNVNRMLMRKKVSLGSHINSIWLLLLSVIVLDVFLLISFTTFTDTSSISTGVLNSVIIAVVALSIDFLAQRNLRRQSMHANVSEIVSEIITETRMAIQFIEKQMDLGAVLLQRARDQELARRSMTQMDLMHYNDTLDEKFKDLVAGHSELQRIQQNLAMKAAEEKEYEYKLERIPVAIDDETLVPWDAMMGEMEFDSDWEESDTLILVLDGLTRESDLETLRFALAESLDVSIDRIEISPEFL